MTIVAVCSDGREDFAPCQSLCFGSGDESPAANFDRSYLAARDGGIERRFPEREPLKELRNGISDTIYGPGVHLSAFRRAQKKEAFASRISAIFVVILWRARHLKPSFRATKMRLPNEEAHFYT